MFIGLLVMLGLEGFIFYRVGQKGIAKIEADLDWLRCVATMMQRMC